MNRKKFFKNALLGTLGLAAGAKSLKAKDSKVIKSTYDRLIEQVGFNHLPTEEVKNSNKKSKIMKSVLHKANTRGHADHGWLNSNHTFSFANYYHPERMNFGVLRVLNDDVVAAGRGFNKHPHDNMEIVSIPLEGDLEHKDSMGNTTIIKKGDIQVMSAGTGVTHSEYNKNQDQEVKFLQIWMFPNQKNVTPRYDQITLDEKDSKNKLQQILSPNKEDEGVWVNQNAWFHIGDLEKGIELEYSLKQKGNGVYAFVLEGEVKIEDQSLSKRDGLGIWEVETISISTTSDKGKLLLMEVPMNL